MDRNLPGESLRRNHNNGKIDMIGDVLDAPETAQIEDLVFSGIDWIGPSFVSARQDVVKDGISQFSLLIRRADDGDGPGRKKRIAHIDILLRSGEKKIGVLLDYCLCLWVGSRHFYHCVISDSVVAF